MRPPQSPPAKDIVLGLLAAAALAGGLRSLIADFPLERDEGEYAYIGRRWLLGDLPYRDAFNQKPPGVFAAYAVIVGLFGTAPAAIHWAAQVYTLGTLAAIFLAGRRLFGPGAGVAAAALAAFLTTDVGVLGNAANTETFMILPLTAGLVATLRAAGRASPAWAAVAGGLGAAALLFKQVALPNVAWHALLLLTADRRRGTLVAVYAGAVAAGLGGVIGAFAAAGALPEFWECVVQYNLAYANRVPLAAYPTLFLTTATYLLWGWGPVLALAVVGLITRSEPEGPAAVRHPRAIAAVWLMVSFVGVAAGGYFREHYYIQAIPPLAVLAGRGAVALGRRLLPAGAEAVATIVTAAAIVFGFSAAAPFYLEEPWEKSRQLYGFTPFPEATVVGDYLRTHAAPDDTIFVWGSEPEILAYADRRSASRYIFMYPVMSALPDAAERQRSIVRELEDRPPRWIVVVREIILGSFYGSPGDTPETVPSILRDAVDRMLIRDYRLVGVVDQRDKTVHPPAAPVTPDNVLGVASMLAVWERRDDAPGR